MKKLVLAFAAAVTLGAPAFATNAVVSFTGGTQFGAFNSDETIGWVFSTSKALTVKEVGWRVNASGSTNSDHLVGLWDSSGTLLGSANVTAGAANDGIWRFVPIAPISLAAGGTYYIGGRDTVGDGDNYVTSVSALVLHPALTFRGSAVSAIGGGFAFPDIVNQITSGGRFGPNFRFHVVPEPATWAMMIAGFGLVGAGLRLRRRRALAL